MPRADIVPRLQLHSQPFTADRWPDLERLFGARGACAGARVVEGYPVEPKDGRAADTFAYHGLASAFRAAGFEEVARRSATRPIMRWVAP